MTAAIQKLDDGTIKLTITIPQDEVKKTRDTVVEEITKSVSVSGFRKGKAPKKLVEEKIDKDNVREETLKKLLPEAYVEAVNQHKLRPIINPKIHVEKLDEDGDWQFTALTCETPHVDLDSYKENIQKITAKQKIIIPGKEPQEPKLDDIVQALLESVTVAIPNILIDQEVDRLLSQLLNEIKSLGLSLEQYLASTKKTAEALRSEYRKKADSDIKLEFTLQKIATEEKIAVEEKEVEEAIQKAKTDEEKKHLTENKYLLASILRQQKTLDFLKNL